jgi:antitoxin component of MazEF toxin-antitoxin module
MIKTITKIGNSRGLIFDSVLIQLARLKEGDQVNFEVHAGGTITIAPFDRDDIDPDEAGEAPAEVIAGNSELLRRLS